MRRGLGWPFRQELAVVSAKNKAGQLPRANILADIHTSSATQMYRLVGQYACKNTIGPHRSISQPRKITSTVRTWTFFASLTNVAPLPRWPFLPPHAKHPLSTLTSEAWQSRGSSARVVGVGRAEGPQRCSPRAPLHWVERNAPRMYVLRAACAKPAIAAGEASSIVPRG
ncbi:hypothetical protein PYCCODRAFT_315553 [Trametes coccinea BRFM310]|uniref:Uncharacterized protein n=1 Tax=Trametes coccinea (strain BRFM310) TaxID=1353009 RepID=A0A1Y2IRN6_TRAC3|nr:hypothetical protein PYCCODRAFT_315553 [Trametes coccinea BRFM310]